MIASSDSIRREPRPGLAPRSVRAAWLGLTLPAGLVVAFLVGQGLWYVAVGLLLILPVLILLQRRPLAGVAIWLAMAPLVAVSDDAGMRKLFWIFHRSLPLVTLALVVASAIAGLRPRRLPRLGWAEALMAGYVVASLVSIAYTASSPVAEAYFLYDHVVAPMCLYFVVRLVEPDERDIKLLFPAVVFLLISQSAIGLMEWISPGLLPSAWLVHLGERTTGSLRDPDLYSVTLLFSGMFVLHFGTRWSKGRAGRTLSFLLFTLAIFMVFLSYSRAAWIAGLIVLAGSLVLYRRHVVKIVPIVTVVVVLVLASGALTGQLEFARARLASQKSEETALSRLPVALAGARMFAAKPATGWGYDSFDRFSLPFQGRVGNLVYPAKVHASHNVYLTLLAEQGALGFILFLGPMFLWLFRARSSVRNMPVDAGLGRRFLAMLWLAVVTHIVVNNFVNMRVTFGLGMWWLTLGLIATVTDRYRAPEPTRDRRRGRETADGQLRSHRAVGVGAR